MRSVAVAALLALLLVPSALAGGGTQTSPLQPPIGIKTRAPQLTEKSAKQVFLAEHKVSEWLKRYPEKGRSTDATYDKKSLAWDVKVWWGKAGEIASGRVDDANGFVLEAWTGAQVAWKMARGYSGAFGGTVINNTWVWLGFCAVFLIGLGNLRRPFTWRNLDLIALLFFSVSLWYFNKGDIFTSVPLAYPPMFYLAGRLIWIGSRRAAGSAFRPVWPVWLLAAATVFLVGFRIGINVEAPHAVIDVGYSGVIGADRISSGQSPYGHMPIEDSLKPCGPADSSGEIRERIQTNGRCESANERGDTYGPVAYEAYLPEVAAFGWSGKWDSLPAAHATSIIWDVLCLIGLALVGLRFGGSRLSATLAFAWAAYPFTAYVLASNTNDAIMPAFLIWGFWLVSSPWARGAFSALGRVDEVRRAAHRAALAVVSGGDEGRAGRSSSSSPGSRRRRSPLSVCCSWSRTRSTPPASSGIAPSGGRSDESRPSHCGTGGSTTRRASPTCTPRSGCSRGCSCSAWSSRTSCPGERALSSSPR